MKKKDWAEKMRELGRCIKCGAKRGDSVSRCEWCVTRERNKYRVKVGIPEGAAKYSMKHGVKENVDA